MFFLISGAHQQWTAKQRACLMLWGKSSLSAESENQKGVLDLNNQNKSAVSAGSFLNAYLSSNIRVSDGSTGTVACHALHRWGMWAVLPGQARQNENIKHVFSSYFLCTFKKQNRDDRQASLFHSQLPSGSTLSSVPSTEVSCVPDEVIADFLFQTSIFRESLYLSQGM